MNTRSVRTVEGKTSAPHGFLKQSDWADPICVFESSEEARPGYTTIPASEYEEEEATFHSKIKLLAAMILNSKQLLAYTGAGISTASGIDDYASKGDLHDRIASSKPIKKSSPLQSMPTYSHFALVRLYTEGLLKRWIQQNHDGLPQKAGLPQSAINEIHGAWFDPSNPVVKFSGNLRDDLFEDLLEWEQKTDVCLAVGTSLSGMNADRVVESCGNRALKIFNKKKNRHDFIPQGSVIIGFQRTRLDGIASLRIYSTIDKVFQALMIEMGMIIDTSPKRPLPSSGMFSSGCIMDEDVFQLQGYCPNTGVKVTTDKYTVLDLRVGRKVVLTSGPYAGSKGEVLKKTNMGHYNIVFTVPRIENTISADPGEGRQDGRPKRMAFMPWNTMLGSWCIEGAMKGELSYLPVVNEP